MGLEVVVGLLIAWAARKAGRVAKRVDGMVDQALDAGLDRVEKVVTAKLGGDQALEQLQLEAAKTDDVSERTQTRVKLALEEAVEQDATFANELEEAVAAAQPAGQQWTGNVTMHAKATGHGRVYQVGQGTQNITEQ